MPTDEEAEILAEAEKVSEESKVHDPVRHPFKYPADWVANINKKISISFILIHPTGFNHILEQYNGSRSIIENE